MLPLTLLGTNVPAVTQNSKFLLKYGLFLSSITFYSVEKIETNLFDLLHQFSFLCIIIIIDYHYLFTTGLW